MLESSLLLSTFSSARCSRSREPILAYACCDLPNLVRPQVYTVTVTLSSGMSWNYRQVTVLFSPLPQTNCILSSRERRVHESSWKFRSFRGDMVLTPRIRYLSSASPRSSTCIVFPSLCRISNGKQCSVRPHIHKAPQIMALTAPLRSFRVLGCIRVCDLVL